LTLFEVIRVTPFQGKFFNDFSRARACTRAQGQCQSGLAQNIGRSGVRGVPVALVVPFDGTKSFAASDNVARVLNLTQRDYAYMRGGPGFHGTLANVDVSSDSSIDHINIDKSPRLHTRVVAEVLAVVGNHKAASAKNGNGADAGTAPTLPEQGGSRLNADNPASPAHKPQAGTQPLHTEEMIPN
jgi:hypothetical protein